MKNFISNILFFALTTLSVSTNADFVDTVQLELNELSEKTNSVFKQAQETKDKVKMNNPIDCIDFIESTDDGVLIQFTKGGCLSDDQILNKKIKEDFSIDNPTWSLGLDEYLKKAQKFMIYERKIFSNIK